MLCVLSMISYKPGRVGIFWNGFPIESRRPKLSYRRSKMVIATSGCEYFFYFTCWIYVNFVFLRCAAGIEVEVGRFQGMR